MAVITFIGSNLSVVAGVPATFDEAGFEALTFAKIGRVLDHGAFGDEHADASAAYLEEGRTMHSNGTADGGTVSVNVEYAADDSDTGLAAIKLASGTNVEQSFKVKDADDESHYFTGIVSNLKHKERTTETRKGFTFDIRVNTAIYGPFEDGA